MLVIVKTHRKDECLKQYHGFKDENDNNYSCLDWKKIMNLVV